MKDAGYPNGRHADTGEQLVVTFDAVSHGDPIEQSRNAWLRKQFKKIGIDLNIHQTDYNRFREKLDNGAFQFIQFGWLADYPDPENFLFLLYGNNGKTTFGGENSTNYNNQTFNELFEQAKALPNNDLREKLITQMISITQKDAPFVWGYHPEAFTLKHAWVIDAYPNDMIRNAAKYYQIDAQLRQKSRSLWNHPVFWPIIFLLCLFAVLIVPVWISYRQKEHHSQVKRF